jgi:hypothetical protein
MPRDIAESDWKKLRALHPIALDRFCQRILEKIGTILADSSRSHHQIKDISRYRLSLAEALHLIESDAHFAPC